MTSPSVTTNSPAAGTQAGTQALIDLDLLIIGAGPAGASLAFFFTAYGLKGMILASTPRTADTPRAHITNMAALECLRDIGLEEDCLKAAVKAIACNIPGVEAWLERNMHEYTRGKSDNLGSKLSYCG